MATGTARSSGASEWSRPAITAAIGCWIGFLVGPNVMVASTNSNFMAELPKALGVGQGELATALAFMVWTVAALVPIAGRLMDRFGVRRVVIPGAILLGVTFLLLSRMTSLWHFFVLQLMLSIPAAMHSSVGYSKIIAQWFDRNRGKVLGLCVALGAGVGQTIMPKLSDAIIRDYGWRNGYLGLALLVLLFGLPLIVLLARSPAASDSARDALPGAADPGDPLGVTTPVEVVDVGPSAQGLSRSEALRTPTFYLIFLAIMLASMSLLGTLQLAKPMLLDRGLANDLAVSVSSFAFAGVILGEFSSGMLVDRVNTPRIILPYFISALIGLLIVHTTATPTILFGGALLMGLGLGGEVGQNAYLVSRYFGLKSFGAIYGLTFAASNLGIGFGVLAMGWVKQLAGTFEPMRYVFGTTMLVSVLCIAMLPQFTFAARRSH